MAVFLPELADEDLTTQLDRTSGYISSVGGTIKEVLTDSPWGRRRLAYPIRFDSQDFRDGFYAVYHFDLEPSAMVDIERELKLDTRVMRYLVVHDDPKAGERNTGRSDDEASTGNADGVSASAPAEATIELTDAPAATETAAATDAIEVPSDTAQADSTPDDAETVSGTSEPVAPIEAPVSSEAVDDVVVPAVSAELESTPEQEEPVEESVPAAPEDDSTDPEQKDES